MQNQSNEVSIKCSACKAPATYNVTKGNIITRMCWQHAKEMQQNYGANIEPIHLHKTEERRWSF